MAKKLREGEPKDPGLNWVNNDDPGQTGIFLQRRFEYLCRTSFSPQFLGHTVRPVVEFLKFQELF